MKFRLILGRSLDILEFCYIKLLGWPLRIVICIVRFPVDIVLLTFHYVKGNLWLIWRFARLKLGLPVKASPYKCLSQFTVRGHYSCRPGRKYANLFIFKSFCPDACHESGQSREASCRDKLIAGGGYWRPPLFRIISVGLVLFLTWSMVGYGIFHFVQYSTSGQRKSAEEYYLQGLELYKRGNYKDAILLFKNAVDRDAKNARFHLELGKCLEKLNHLTHAFSEFEVAVRLKPQLPEGRLEYARLALRLNRFEIALDQAEAVLTLTGDSAEAHLIAAHCLIQQGKLDAARTQLDVAIEKLPGQAPKLHELAAGAFSMLSETDLAKNYYRKALDLDPETIDARLGLAYVFLKESNWDAVEEHLEGALRIESDNINALIARAELYMAKGEIDSAEIEIAKVIELYPNAPRLRLRLAVLLIKYKHATRGAELLLEQINETPTDAEPYIALALNYLKTGQPRMAVVHAKSVLGFPNDNHDRAIWIMAYGQVAQNNYGLALEAIETYLTNNPDDFDMTLLKAFVFQVIEDNESAMMWYRKAAEINPESAIPYISLATFASTIGDHKTAVDGFRNAAKKLPDDPQLSVNLVTSLLRADGTENANEAYEIASRLYERYSDSSIVKGTLAWASYFKGDYGTAENLLEQAIINAPVLPDLYFQLGQVYRKQGKNDDAVAAFKKARNILPYLKHDQKSTKLRELIDDALKYDSID